MIPEYLEQLTAEALLAEMLATLPATIDKRPGSAIYDALAPTAFQLTEQIARLIEAYKNTYAATATGEYLDYRVAEAGIARYGATPAIREGLFYGANGVLMDIPLGSRFSAVNSSQSYQAVAQIATGMYRLQAEQPGAAGNDYLGQLLPITHIPGLQRAEIAEILIPGSDIEGDEALFDRFMEQLQNKAFAGNITAYRQEILALPGVGGVQVYPVWDGGGTVKCSIINSQLLPPSDTQIAEVQEAIDPDPQGMGLGLAPIDHVVTIQGATGRTIAVSATVTVAAGYTLEQLKPLIEASIGTYFEEVRRAWGSPGPVSVLEYVLWIFRARVISQFFAVPGMINVEDLLLDGDVLDIELTENATLQELPLLGEVTLYEA